MPTPNDILSVVVQDLTDELAPLDSIYHNFAKYKVDAIFDDDMKPRLEVRAPERVRIFVPTTYQSFPVNFIEEVEARALVLDTTFEINVKEYKHGVYA